MKQRGFTLIEVLVAMAILAVVIMATHQILDSTTKAKEASDEKIAELNGSEEALDVTSIATVLLEDEEVLEADAMVRQCLEQGLDACP